LDAIQAVFGDGRPQTLHLGDQRGLVGVLPDEVTIFLMAFLDPA
jgi:hypothetical protein